MSASTTNYTGRQVDLALFPDIAAPNVFESPRIGPNAMAIAGIMAMAQNYLRILLTPLGTYPSAPSLGSNFMSRMQSTKLRYASDIVHVFVIESARVVAFMQSVDQNKPLDEQILSATLTGQSLTNGNVSMAITLLSNANTPVSLLLPVVWNQ